MSSYIGGGSVDFPYSSVTYIEARYADGSRVSGSGVLVGKNDVLTAAHLVYDPITDSLAEQITVYPGRDGSSVPFGSFEAAFVQSYKVRSDSEGRLFQSDSEDDIALIALDQPVGDYLQWFDVGALTSGGPGRLTGYPGAYSDATGPRLMEDLGYVSPDPNYDLLRIDNLEVSPGSSGGPVWFASGNAPVVAGTVSTGSWAAELEPHSATLDQWIASNDEYITVPAPEVDALPGSVVRLYSGLLQRDPDQQGFEYWLETGERSSLVDVAFSFLISDEAGVSSDIGDDEFLVDYLYNTVLDRKPDASGRAYWLGELESDQLSTGELVLYFTDSAEYRSRVDDQVENYLTSSGAESSVSLAGLSDAEMTDLEGNSWL
ncbi:MAG: DUF4214 domain-containing protein [Alteromonadaceae bacterium]|nr:DUF4214 domain-containing protein [Alteromonadaceae bacterium]